MSDQDNTPEYRIEEVKQPIQYDPELQRIVIESRLPEHTRTSLNLSHPGPRMIDVVAKLRNAELSVPGLHVAKQIGPIITGTVDVDRIEDVRQHENVVSLKAARPLERALYVSVPQIQATRQHLQSTLTRNKKPIDGAGVIIGIVDYGCDFTHSNFRSLKRGKNSGATRLLYLWDQQGECNDTLPPGGNSPKPYGYGREFNSDEINKALEQASTDPLGPFKYLNYTPKENAHGTPVMDIAAGNGGRTFANGVAPAADIIFVDVAIGDNYMTGESYGNSRRLLDAVAYIFDKAEERKQAAVVNISLNYDGGPHDGSTLVEEGFDSLLEKPGRAIVIAAGNSRVRKIHVRRTLYTKRTHTLRWHVGEDKASRNKIDLWYDGRRAILPTLRSTRKEVLGPFKLGSTYEIYRKNELAGFVFHRANDPNNGDHNLVLAFTSRMEAGVWELNLKLLPGNSDLPVEFHAWAETDSQRSFFPDALPTDSACTLGTFGCGNSTIVVGAYDATNPRNKYGGSAAGPTRDGKLKPEVSAPGVNVYSASARNNSVGAFTGTSAAAPHVAGLIALLLQAAGRLISIEQIRHLVTFYARPEPAAQEPGWNQCYGDGCIDVKATLEAQPNAAKASKATKQHAKRSPTVDEVNGNEPPKPPVEDTSRTASV